MNDAERSLNTWMGGAWFASGYCGWRSFTSDQVIAIATDWLEQQKRTLEAVAAFNEYVNSDEVRDLIEDETISRNKS